MKQTHDTHCCRKKTDRMTTGVSYADIARKMPRMRFVKNRVLDYARTKNVGDPDQFCTDRTAGAGAEPAPGAASSQR